MARGWFLIGFTNRRSMRATRFDPKLISLSLAHRWFSFCFNEPPRWFRVGIKWVWCDLFVVIRPLIGRFGARSNDQDGTSIRPSLLIGLINRWIDSFCVTTRPFCGHRFVARLSFVLFLPPVLSSMAVSGEIKKLFVLMFSGRPSWIECTRKLFRGFFCFTFCFWRRAAKSICDIIDRFRKVFLPSATPTESIVECSTGHEIQLPWL